MSFAGGGVGNANGFEGSQQTQTNVGQPTGVQTQVQPQQTQQDPQTQNPPVATGVPGVQQPGQQTDEFGHRIRSALTSAEQTWRQQNQAALDLANTLQQMGRDPNQVLQQVREAQRQAQIEAQQAQGISPQMAQHMQNLEQQVQSVQRVVGEQRLAEAERNLVNFAKTYGVNYEDPTTKMEIRQYAYDNNINLDTAFKSLYFDRIMQVNSQQAQGQVIAAMQGRGNPPISTAVPGSTQSGPVNFLNMSDKDFADASARMKEQHYQR